MYIDTHSKNQMEQSICGILNISSDMLYEELAYIGSQVENDDNRFLEQLEMFIEEHYPTTPPEKVMFFHLARRLKDAEDSITGHNLFDLLTTDNPFSFFMKKHDVEFQIGDGHIDVINRGKLVNWDKCYKGNPSYMKWRLGYFEGRKDFCFNGFAFKDLLYKNDYARSLFRTPEFLGQMITCLERPEIGTAYMHQSSYYCYEYHIPFDRILFDENENYSLGAKRRHLIRCVIERLNNYANSNIRYMYDRDNPILRLGDSDTLDATFFVSKEKITVDMLG